METAIAQSSSSEVAGNLFIWFLCAVAFLKVSQKIDSFLSSLGLGVGRTGSNMLGELMVAGRAVKAAVTGAGWGAAKAVSESHSHENTTTTKTETQDAPFVRTSSLTSPLSTRYSQTHSQTEQTNDLSRFSTDIPAVVSGRGELYAAYRGDTANEPMYSYFGMKGGENSPIPSYRDVCITEGRISGTEISPEGTERNFTLFEKRLYEAKDLHDTMKAEDGTEWIRHYADDPSPIPVRKDEAHE